MFFYKKTIKYYIFLILFLVFSFLLLNPQQSLSSEVDLSANDADAIAIRIMPNPNNYNINQWYRLQGFTGSPQSMIVDGYKAIRDGRTVYISAVNVDLDKNNLYFNIYLISYNQEADDKTIDIFGKILNSFKLNTNIKDRTGYCNISSILCETSSDCPSPYVCGGLVEDNDSGITKIGNIYQKNRCIFEEDDYNQDPINTPACMLDSDCPNNFFCTSMQAVLIRDTDRLEKINNIRSALERYANLNGHYPILLSGTYVPYIAISSWPSWQSIFLNQLGLSNIIDPINTIGSCFDNRYKFDLKTCWEANKASFISVDNPINNSNFSLPEYSNVFSYVGDMYGKDFSLYSSMETLDHYQEDFTLPNGENMSDLEPPYIIDDKFDAYNNPYFTKANLFARSGEPFLGTIEAEDPRGRDLSWAVSNCLPGTPLFEADGIIEDFQCPPLNYLSWTPSNKVPEKYNTNTNKIIELRAEKAGSSSPINSFGEEIEKEIQYIISVLIWNANGHEARMNFPIYTKNVNPAIQNKDNDTYNLSTYNDFSFDIDINDNSGLKEIKLCHLNENNTCLNTWNLLPGSPGSKNFTGSSLFNNKLVMDFIKNSDTEYSLKIKNKNTPYSGDFNANHIKSHKFRIIADDGYDAITQKDFVITFTAQPPQLDFSNCSNKVVLDNSYSCNVRSTNPQEVIAITDSSITPLLGQSNFLTLNQNNKIFSGNPNNNNHLGSHQMSVTISNEFGLSDSGDHIVNVYTKPTVTTTEIDDHITSEDIAVNSFVCRGHIVSTGFNNTNGYKGCILNTNSSNLTLGSASNCTSSNNCSGSASISDDSDFSSSISDLSRNTKYYYRAFAINEAGIGYGSTLNFITRADYPKVFKPSLAISDNNLVLLSSNISDNGGAPLTLRGIFWSTDPNKNSPLGTDLVSDNVNSIGDYSFNTLYSKFAPGQTYHFRAYAINKDSAGREKMAVSSATSYTIPIPPSISTSEISNSDITNNSAKSGSTIDNPSSVNISECGIVYRANTSNPTIANAKIENNSCTGDNLNFISNITGLNEDTTYHVRAYIISDFGIFYGNNIFFKTRKPSTLTYNGNDHTSGEAPSSHTGFYIGDIIKLKSKGSLDKTNHDFSGWGTTSSGGTIYSANDEFTLTSTSHTLYAYWTLKKRNLTISKNLPAGGSVTGPGGINCGGTCISSFDHGTSVTLTPTPASGYVFTGWAGDCSSNSIVMNANKSCTANFVKVHTVTYIRNNTSAGNLSPSTREVNDGSSATGPTLTTNSGYEFDKFTIASGSCAGTFNSATGACSNVQEDITIRANWIDNTKTVKLTVGPNGTVHVFRKPDVCKDCNSISCSSNSCYFFINAQVYNPSPCRHNSNGPRCDDENNHPEIRNLTPLEEPCSGNICSYTVNSGQSLYFHRAPNSGYTSSISGTTSGNNLNNITSDTNVSVNFTQSTYTVTYISNISGIPGSCSGSISNISSGSTANRPATCNATRDSFWQSTRFTRTSGAGGTLNSHTGAVSNVTGNQTISANFRPAVGTNIKFTCHSSSTGSTRTGTATIDGVGLSHEELESTIYLPQNTNVSAIFNMSTNCQSVGGGRPLNEVLYQIGNCAVGTSPCSVNSPNEGHTIEIQMICRDSNCSN